MGAVLAVVLALMVGVAPAVAADAWPTPGEQIGNGETAVATAPPAAPGSQPSAMPRTIAQRLHAARPEMIFGVLAALMLVTALVLGVRSVIGVYRRR